MSLSAIARKCHEWPTSRSSGFGRKPTIPANIVEGREQKSEAEFRRFLRYALSSTSEPEYHLIIARDINVISAADFVGVLVPLKEVRMMLFGLLKRLDSPTSRSIERDNPLSGG